MLEPVHSHLLYDEWLAPTERDEKRKFIQSDDHIHTYHQPPQPSFFLEDPLHPAPPSLPSYNNNTPII